MRPGAQTIQAVLFATADTYSVTSLAALLNISVPQTEIDLESLKVGLEGQAIMLVREGGVVTLATRPEHGTLLETIRRDELQKDLSKASSETLAIVVYRPGVSKAEIELIRGVNASYSLRALQMRGLVETKGVGRAITYHPTLALLEHFGVQRIEDLPVFTETKQKIESLLNNTQSE